MTNKYVTVGLFLFAVTCCLVWPTRAETPPVRSVEQLQMELSDVRSSITNVEQQISISAQKILRQKHDLEYQDPDFKKLHDEIVVLEKQLLEKKNQMDAKLALVPDVKRTDAERRELFKKLSDLREQETLIQNEIKTAGYATKEAPGKP